MIRGLALAEHRSSDEAGFTLVELLVALALFSLLSVLLFDNVRFGLHAWQYGSARAEHFERSLVSQELLRRIIGNIYPMLVTDGGVQSWVDFDGSKEAVSFLGDAPIVAGGAGRFLLKIFVERQESRTDLVMSARPELANPQDSSMTTKTILLPDIDHVELSYFGGAAAERNVKWQDDWKRRTDMPTLVRIRVALRSGDARSWPDLVIAPRITADVSCIYDQMTKRCRGR